MQNQKTEKKYSHVFLLGWLVLPIIFTLFLAKMISTNDVFAKNLLARDDELIEVPDIKLAEYPNINHQNSGAVSLWFNNGWSSQYTYAPSLLEAKGMRGTMSVITSYAIYPSYVNWDEMKFLQDKGWEIVSQTRSYECNLKNLSPEQIHREVFASKRDFLKHDIHADNFASPCGVVDSYLTDRVRSYYSSQKIGEDGINYLPLQNPYLLKSKTITNETTVDDLVGWLEETKRMHAWLILTINQIDDTGSASSIAPKKFNTAIETIEKSLIPTVVPSQMINERTVQGDPSLW